MKRLPTGQLQYSPSDLIRFVASPFASWMDRFHLENPGTLNPDKETEEQRLIARTGDHHEQEVLESLQASGTEVFVVPKAAWDVAREHTVAAFAARPPVIYQAALKKGPFAGFADFLELDSHGRYQVWDTKLARSPKAYFAIQLCCYSEMLAEDDGGTMATEFGVILGGKNRVVFRVEDFIHYYRRVKSRFLDLQESFDGQLQRRPEPVARADHGRWSSHADAYFSESDHLVQVAGISVGQIKKLRNAGVHTVADLARGEQQSIPKLAVDSLAAIVRQARLQVETRNRVAADPDALPAYEVLPHFGPNGEPVGLGSLPPAHDSDVFFDMEGYPLVPGGLEYLFGACTVSGGETPFKDWWAHDRESEKVAFEAFIDWVHARWRAAPDMHIYHYAAYEVSAVRRLSCRHDTREEEVDALLRAGVFVDLYKVIQKGLCLGLGSYSIKYVERLYRPARTTSVATAGDSIVQYAAWLDDGGVGTWETNPILKGIRDYNEDDCVSTVELTQWLRQIAAEHGIPPHVVTVEIVDTGVVDTRVVDTGADDDDPESARGSALAKQLRDLGDDSANVLADLIGFHRREEKPMWWRMFDRASATTEELRDDLSCIEGVKAEGETFQIKRSWGQKYVFDLAQDCKLSVGAKSQVLFTHELTTKLNLVELDRTMGILTVKLGATGLNEKFGGEFPRFGSLIPCEGVPADAMHESILDIGELQLENATPASVKSMLNRISPAGMDRSATESSCEAAIRIAKGMAGDCLVIQGPPGTGKTYAASHVIEALLADGKRVGISSNSHKAIINLLRACADRSHQSGIPLLGLKVGGEIDEAFFAENPSMGFEAANGEAWKVYRGGVLGGTAWLFSRPEWSGVLDYLFIDEAGQVSLANAVAMARSAKNVVLLGDQMQLEQPVQGSHPGDSALSVLQYALKDIVASQPDSPVFHSVVPPEVGLFLSPTYRMHPDICHFISESVYDGKLESHPDCAKQHVSVSNSAVAHVWRSAGIVFSGIEHDGNTQRSDEEVRRVVEIFEELVGLPYTSRDGDTRPLDISDFLFIAPYNAQVRALEQALPSAARVGSVDKFQGQEAPVCVVSFCSSVGEYGSRGLSFILDRNRVNVAISRAQCLAVVVADPRIAGADAGSIQEMELLNLFCKLVDVGTQGD